MERVIVNSLGDYMEYIAHFAEADCVGKRMEIKENLPILWFRGQSNANYSLIPSLYRRKNVQILKDTYTKYTRAHYAEDIRTQHYIAKNFHLLSKEPSSRVEWLEVMQHHQMYTRVLDWSESSLHSLLFALEPFFDNGKYREADRRKSLPCVWVLSPKKMNKNNLESLEKDKELQKCLLSDLEAKLYEKQKILDNIRKYSDFEYYAQTEDTCHIDYIFNLSSINDEVLRDRERLKELLMQGEVINPYYYLLSRVYSDGYVLPERNLAPLCVVHPYHSERIRAQRGVFTVFPFYRDQPGDSVFRELGINPDAMEQNDSARKCLRQILINDPQKVAMEMMGNGMYDSWLYPEMPVVSSEIENHMIY